MPNHRSPLRSDQLIPVSKVANEKEKVEKGLEEEEEEGEKRSRV
jgi:hypothetical protein